MTASGTAVPASPPAARQDSNGPIEGDITIPLARQRVRVYVWQVPVRVTHWITFGSVAVLSVTGGYIADPFFFGADERTMGVVRSLHMLFAFIFVASGILRTYWLFVGNRFSNWRAFFPHSRHQFREMGHQTGWYVFARSEVPTVLGHNALAAGTYIIVFGLFLLQTFTGFALAAVHGTEPWATLFGWVTTGLGVQTVRLIHHLLMWAVIAFMIHHIYSALLVDHFERNGLMSSIFSGNKFVTRREIQEARDGGWDVQGVAE